MIQRSPGVNVATCQDAALVAIIWRFRLPLKPDHAAVDKPGMAIDELQFDTVNQRNLQVLHAYADRHFAAKAADDDYNGWLDRVESAGELTADELIRVHGELIALGMLRFELTNRHTGLRYQISERGHLALQMQKSASDYLIHDVDEFDSAETLPLTAGKDVAAELGDLGAEAA